MRSKYASSRIVLALAIALQPFLASISHGGELLGRLNRLVKESKYHGTKPEMGADCAIEALAENIDWLEHHIDTYGSIVAKQPDIWGEARLTKHRDEYERMMFGELNQFKSNINAAIAQGDSSFLAQALALSAAASGSPAVAIGSDEATSNSVTSEIKIGDTTARTVAADPVFGNAEGTINSYQRFGIAEKPGEPGVTLEPVIHLDQMSRYLNHLHQLRRINEGDDTSDSPGYSMNLVRMPVSILPGKLTREGFGAEITVTATPVISDDLMPTTFRNLAVNDVVDQLRLPVMKVAEYLPYESKLKVQSAAYRNKVNEKLQEYYALRKQRDIRIAELKERKKKLARFNKQVADLASTDKDGLEIFAMSLPEERRVLPSTDGWKNFSEAANLQNLVLPNELSPKDVTSRLIEQNAEQFRKELIARGKDEIEKLQEGEREAMAEIARREEEIKEMERVTSRFTTEFLNIDQFNFEPLVQIPLAGGRARRAKNPIPPTQLLDVYGKEQMLLLANGFRTSYRGRHVRWNGCADCEDSYECRANILDVQRWLDAETSAAVELLSQPENVCLFAALASPSSKLARQIRNEQFCKNGVKVLSVEKYRNYFFRELHAKALNSSLPKMSDDTSNCDVPAGYTLLKQIDSQTESHSAASVVEGLAWALVVESALLNERLNQDVRKLTKAKEIYDLNTEREYHFFLPDTVLTPGMGFEPLQGEYQLANEIFKRYVKERWPIHVFAIDPSEQDQNVASVSQRKRELQFALALGFATGKIGGNSLTQYSRMLDTSIETIDLNRTIVGFGHGSDTFGWRFHPRVQPLDVPGTFGSIRETLTGTSRDYDLRHRQIEPGQRECVAVVLMPSFVPYADFDVRSNWFKLTNPKNAALTMKDTVKLSRAVTAMRNSKAQCAQCQHLYRDGELRRLFVRVNQLDRELPLQTQRALVPYENTLGGFEMFNTGVTDLAPELVGWYGAPGVNTTDGYDCGCKVDCGSDAGDCESADCKAVATSVTALEQRVTALEADPSPAPVRQQPIPTCEGAGTTLFLVGDNFSVHDTKVIAGGVCIPHVRLISREFMRVTIPSCVNTVQLCENGKTNEYVAVYVATPYGVTNHLHVPVIRKEKPKVVNAPVPTISESKMTVGPAGPRSSKQVVYARLKNPKDSDSKELKFSFGSDASPEMIIKSRPSERPKHALEIYAAFRDGFNYFHSPVKVRSITTESPMVGETFTAVGDTKAQGKLLEALDEFDSTKFTNGKKALSLVYFACRDGIWSNEPLNDPLEVEVRLVAQIPVCTNPNAALSDATANQNNGSKHEPRVTSPGPLPLPGFASPAAAEPEVVRPLQDTNSGSPLPLNHPSSVQFRESDCGCGDQQTALPGRLPVVTTAYAPNRTRAQFVQQPAVGNPSARLSTEIAGLEARFNERLDRLDQSLPTVESQRNLIRQELANRPQAVIPSTALATQPVVNVQVNPVVEPEQKHQWWDESKHPLIQQTKIRVGENWRNLRDRIPRY